MTVMFKTSALIIAATICSCIGTCSSCTSNQSKNVAIMPRTQLDTHIGDLAEMESAYIHISSVKVNEYNECHISSTARVYRFPFNGMTPVNEFIKVKRNKGLHITILKSQRWVTDNIPSYGSWKPAVTVTIAEQENWK